jgi:hypothetical protein
MPYDRKSIYLVVCPPPCQFRIQPIAIASCLSTSVPPTTLPTLVSSYRNDTNISQYPTISLLPSTSLLPSYLLLNTVSSFSLCSTACVRKYSGIYRLMKGDAITYCWRGHNRVHLQDGGFSFPLQDLLRCKDQSSQCILCSYYGNVIF